MKRYFYFAAAAALMAACSQSDDLALTPQTATQQAEQVPVEFGVYVGKNTTRAGAAGDVTTNTLGAETTTGPDGGKGVDGFGIFAFYTDDEQYSQLALPDFMYNEHIKGNSNWTPGSPGSWTAPTTWSYSPVKYWPNEFGDGAISNATDYLSFFAYAPYVAVDEITGLPTGDREKNIIQLSKNTTQGDPFVKYRVDWNPATSVDLCWGVQPDADHVAASDYEPITGSTPVWNDNKGLPYINLIKEKKADAGKVKFQFYHALAKLNVQIDTDIDIKTGPGAYSGASDSEVEAIGGDATGSKVKTRVYVRSVTFEGFATEGTLNLHNIVATTPLWKASDATSILAANSVTIYDGLQDGAEVTSNNSSEKPTGLNPMLVQDLTAIPSTSDATVWNVTGENANHKGVRKDLVNLFTPPATGTDDQKAAASIYVIPNGATPKVTIVYDVETIDPNLSGYLADGKTHGSSVENKITKSIFSDLSKRLEAGKAYKILLHLGLTSVKVDAAVQGWDDTTAKDVTLPYND